MLRFLLPLWERNLISKDLDSLPMVREKWQCQSYFCTETLIGCEVCLGWLCQHNLGRQNTQAYGLFSLKMPIPRSLGVLSRCKRAHGIREKAEVLLLAQSSARLSRHGGGRRARGAGAGSAAGGSSGDPRAAGLFAARASSAAVSVS